MLAKKNGEKYPLEMMQSYSSISKKADGTIRFGCYPNKEQEIGDEEVAKYVISVPANWRAK